MQFSTDPVPSKSKSKCLFMCGKSTNVKYPAKLQLNGKDLPWVPTATHLGHELHQNCNMDHDIRIKRAQFINESIEIRDTFSFAQPEQVLQAIKVYCGHYYGSMLWELDGDMVGQYCRAWNTCVKLTYGVPRSTHTYLVENLLAKKFIPVRTELMSRFVQFYCSLLQSPSKEVQTMAIMVKNDARTTTARNLEFIQKESGLDFTNLTANGVRSAVPRTPIPENMEWTVSLLPKLLKQRREIENTFLDTSFISISIDSLCSS